MKNTSLPKRRPVLATISLCLSLVFLGCSSVGSIEKEGKKLPFFGSMEVRRFVLPNGLKLLVLEDPSSPTFAYQTWFRVDRTGGQLPDRVPGAARGQFGAHRGFGQSMLERLERADLTTELPTVHQVLPRERDAVLGQHCLLGRQ